LFSKEGEDSYNSAGTVQGGVSAPHKVTVSKNIVTKGSTTDFNLIFSNNNGIMSTVTKEGILVWCFIQIDDDSVSPEGKPAQARILRCNA
jgi:hypothetical protein